MITLNLRRNIAALYAAIACHAFAFYVLYNTLVLWLFHLHIPQATATSRFGMFVLAAYVTPLIGGWLSKPIGLRPVAIIGAGTAAIGYLTAAFVPHLALAGIVLVGLGCGFVKTSITAMVGRLFPEGDPRIDKVMAWFYGFINVGALASPVVASHFMATNSFSKAFAVAALGDLAVLLVVALNFKSLDVVESASSIAAVTGVAVDLPSDSDTEGRLAEAAEKAAGRRRKLTALWIFLILATIAFWPAYHQNGSGLNLWAAEHTDRIVWGHEIQPPMFALVNSLVCIFCGGLIVRAVGWLAGGKGRHLSTPGEILDKEFMPALGWSRATMSIKAGIPQKRLNDILENQAITQEEAMMLGRTCGTSTEYWLNLQANANRTRTVPLSFSTGLGYLTMAASFACLLAAPIAKSHPAWLVVAIVLSSIAEILISSLGLAQVAKLTPRHLQPIYTSIWFVTSGIGGQLAGWLSGLELLTGFRVLVVLCLTGALITSSLRRKLDV